MTRMFDILNCLERFLPGSRAKKDHKRQTEYLKKLQLLYTTFVAKLIKYISSDRTYYYKIFVCVCVVFKQNLICAYI